MGGLSFTRHRLQGCIKGKVEKLRAQHEQIFKKSQKQQKASKGSTASRPNKDNKSSRVSETPSPSPAPVAIKRRRVVGLVAKEEEEVATKRGPMRKLGDNFERVAKESGMAVNGGSGSDGAMAARMRSKRNDSDEGTKKGKINTGKRKLVKGGRKLGSEVVATGLGVRTLPRLAKNNGLLYSLFLDGHGRGGVNRCRM